MDKVKIPVFTYYYNEGKPYRINRVTGMKTILDKTDLANLKYRHETEYSYLRTKYGMFYGSVLESEWTN